MSEPNDKLLEEYLRRESIVSQRYRELDAAEVPPQLDAAVLARARAAMAMPGKRKPSWVKWGAPLALAASAVMVVAIVLEVGVQDEVRMPAPQIEQAQSTAPTLESRAVRDAVEQAPPTAPATPAAEKPETAIAKVQDARAESERNAEAPRERKAETLRALAPPSTEHAAVESVIVTGARRPESAVMDSSSPVAVMEASALEETIVTANRAPQMRASGAAPEAFELTAGGLELQRRSEKVADVAVAQAPRLAPEPWLERIRALRRESKVLEADQQWREFREAYPQFEVSETDSARPKP